jgi:16S rRNA (cytosine967-C5)-methyltransferase
VTNVVNHLRAGGSLVYSTCSVFKAENEENVEFFLKNLPLKLKDKEYLSGYEKKADSLFVASFEKVSN